ncbi:MAG: PASTA domain-containing protein, partial [Pseudonocardia sp.]|nr:PASTA domain-containing protein [Pseudonocardia sp.]
VEDKGRVVRTDPPAGVEVAERQAVTIFVGSGPAVATVPPLTGLSVAEAEAQLATRGLVLGEQSTVETSDEALVDRIIRYTPVAGAEAPGGSAVAVVVGTRPTTREVPDVAGQSVGDARQTLEGAGFTNVTEEQVDGGGESGDVLGTNPAAGTQADPASTITIQVSRGNELTVPGLVGLSRDDAVRALNDAGFSNSDVRFQERGSDDSQDGQVIEQSIGEGEALQEGDRLVVTVGDGGGGFPFDN